MIKERSIIKNIILMAEFNQMIFQKKQIFYTRKEERFPQINESIIPQTSG
jgi:hypothetical protein